MNVDLRDEVRNGFYIPTAIKQAWNAQIKVLSEINRICEKYDIEYFADWGTLLSAVRHGGYIPWDDDLDICMKREDYVKFREVADKELPSSFAIHDYERQKDHWLFITKVVNTNHISYEEKHLQEYNNFPYIACVDIFILDYLYKDPKTESDRCDEIKRIMAYADGIVEGRISGDKKERFLAEINAKYNWFIDKNLNSNDCGIKLYALIEKRMAEVDEKDADKIGQIFPWVLKGFSGYPKSYYEESVKLPYENGFIRVPCAYDEVLSKKYGNYLRVVKGSAAHGYPFFEGQKAELLKEGDIELPEFVFDKNKLQKEEAANSDSLKSIAAECLMQMKKMLDHVFELFSLEAFDDIKEILPKVQELAIDLGTLTDSVVGEGNPAVDSLSDLCEKLYFLYENPSDLASKKSLENSFDIVNESVGCNIIKKEVAVFIAIGARNWKSFEMLYQDERNKGVFVCVINVPLYYKDIFGRLSLADDMDMGEFPDGIEVMKTDSINISLLRPDRIYVQDSYEEFNPALSVHPKYYGSKLREYTKELIFVQPMDFADFNKSDMCENYNIHHYAAKPGVVYADKIILSSDVIKDRYVEALTEFAGDDTKDYWENIIFVQNIFEDNEKITGNKKRLLYCIGLNELYEEPQVQEKLINERLGIISSREDIEVLIKFYPEDNAKWNDIKKICKDCGKSFEELSKICDAYYGSPSPIVPVFVQAKKPVMISRKEVIS